MPHAILEQRVATSCFAIEITKHLRLFDAGQQDGGPTNKRQSGRVMHHIVRGRAVNPEKVLDLDVKHSPEAHR